MLTRKDKNLQVEGVYVKKPESGKKHFYPIIMTFSAFCLLLAILVYTFYPTVMKRAIYKLSLLSKERITKRGLRISG